MIHSSFLNFIFRPSPVTKKNIRVFPNCRTFCSASYPRVRSNISFTSSSSSKGSSLDPDRYDRGIGRFCLCHIPYIVYLVGLVVLKGIPKYAQKILFFSSADPMAEQFSRFKQRICCFVLTQLHSLVLVSSCPPSPISVI